MNCIHYKICITLHNDFLCNDSRCILNKKQIKIELNKQREQVRITIDKIKNQLGIENFLELNRGKNENKKWVCF